MRELWRILFSSNGFMPHGHCYLWQPGVVWLHLISDGLIALAYTSIPFTLVYFVRRRRDVPFHWMFLCFGAFIVACGATHVMEIWTLWHPAYWLSGIVKAATALSSLTTTALLVRLVPTALRIPTPTQLARAHEELREAHEALERRVEERTAELSRKNAELAAEIAERERAELALSRSQRKFRRLADAGIIGVVTSDLQGRICEANDAFLRMTGYTDDEILAGEVRWRDMTPPEHRAASERAIAQLRSTGVAVTWEKEYIRKNGERVPVLVGAASVDATSGENVAFVLDLTEQKRAAEAIRRLEHERQADAQFRALVEAAPDAMVISDAAGHIVLINAEAERLFGYARADLIGQPVEILVPEGIRAGHAGHRAGFRRCTGRHVMGAGDQLAGRRSDGSEFPADLSLSTIRTDRDVLISTTIRDVTERKQAEEALLRAKDAAEIANTELETFSYSVAHDLRSPLRGISGYGTALLEDYGDQLDDGARDYLSRIIRGSRRMGEIIDALLALARLTRTEPRHEKVDLGELGRDVVEQLRAAAPERVVDFVVHAGLFVQGDPGMLRVLLENLLGNAWKFTAKRPDARIELGRQDSDDAPVYYVRDDGAGFDPRLASKLFVPFRRLHAPSEFEGTGLGLATVQRIIRSHGGRIWAEAAEAQGATFRFTLPSSSRPKTTSRIRLV